MRCDRAFLRPIKYGDPPGIVDLKRRSFRAEGTGCPAERGKDKGRGERVACAVLRFSPEVNCQIVAEWPAETRELVGL
jgi:hypothetical protein